MGKKNRSKRGKAKGGGRARGDASSAPRSTSAAAAGNASGTFGNWSNISATLDRSSGDRTQGDNNIAREGAGVGMYQRYKRATTSVKDFLRLNGSTTGSSGNNNQQQFTAVNDLSKAAEHIYHRAISAASVTSNSGVAAASGSEEKAEAEDDAAAMPPAIEIPKEILQELDVSISLREQVGEAYGGGGGDEGHRYMVNTLKYVRKLLLTARSINRMAKRARRARNASAASAAGAGATSVAPSTGAADSIGGKFSALAVDDEESDEENEEEKQVYVPVIDEEMIRSGNIPEIVAPEETEEQAKLSIDDLIKGGDRFQAILFLQSLEFFMGSVDQHFGMLKAAMRGEPSAHKCDSTLQLLMECTVASNYATSSIRTMEAALASDYEYLASFYTILAIVLLPDRISELEERMFANVRAEKPDICKKFVGDIVECSFHNRGNEKISGVTRRFVKASKLQYDVVERYAKEINIVATIEVMLDQEKAQNAQMLAHVARTLGHRAPKPHSWLKESSYYVGGDRSILNTQKLIQTIFDVARKDTKLISKGNLFGAVWDESSRPAKKIQGDMDALLATDVMPELLEIGKRLPSGLLPGQRELLPLLDLIAEQVRDQARPVPMSLTFGVHAILTSVLVLQGNGDVSRLASGAKQTWEKLFDQLEEQSNTSLPQPPVFFQNVKLFKDLVRLAKPIGPTSTSSSEMNVFWNPVCAGSYLLFGTYICSIGLGSATIDSFAQLRFTLHLFNALKERGLISEDMELLSNLDKAFVITKAVWVTRTRPEQGEFMKSFLLAWGHSPEDASKKASDERNMHLHGRQEAPTQLDTSTTSRDPTRKLAEIKPEDYSKSYRRIAMQDFSDAVDTYSVRNASEKQRKDFGDFLDFVSRVNMTRDAIDDDEDNIIPFNFVSIGGVLNEFVCELSKEMGWEEQIKTLMSSIPEEIRRNDHGYDGRRLRGFNTSDANFERCAVAQILATLLGEADFSSNPKPPSLEKAASIMTSFFTEEKKEHCIFLVDPPESQNASHDASSNPLLGDFPYGRTGRTPIDPLKGFAIFKRSKAGKPIVRLIKPGKRTPFVVVGGKAESPYGNAATSFKLPMQVNGRYRHIASYTLQELVDLDWDGAKYNSTTLGKGLWVPYIPGYDSDPDDRYDRVDVAAGKRAGLVGLTKDEVGLYLDVPTHGVMKLQK